MAKFMMDFPEDLMRTLYDSDFSEIASLALKRMGPVMTESVKKSLSESANGKYATGTMVESVKETKPIKTRTDAYMIVSRPTGKDKRGVRNMEKAVYLEYGTVNETARPWLTRAVNNAEDEILAIAQETYEEVLGNLLGGF